MLLVPPPRTVCVLFCTFDPSTLPVWR